MSTSTLKKSLPSTSAVALQRDIPTASTTPLLFANEVEQTFDLGKGFVVIKLRPESSRKARQGLPTANLLSMLNTSFPDISLNQIHSLLKQQIKVPPVRSGSVRANREFTAQLNKQSLDFRQRQRDEGLLLTSADFLAPLGISRQALSKAVKEQRMFYVEGPSNTQLYPAFFVTDKHQRRLLEKVSRALGDLPGPSKWQFFITPKLSLGGRSPVKAIQDGDLDRTLTAAAAFKGR